MAFKRLIGKGNEELAAGMRSGVIGGVSAVVMAVLLSGPATAQTCPRDAFEAVVDEASSTLVVLNQKNAPTFQAKLRQLKDKRGWTQEQFLKEGAPFVQDASIAAFDETSQQLLIKINSQNTETADCRLLADLKAAMATLVETQNAKWSYMFGKLDKELAK
jgi:predicted dithiol-disulfide oxidoreductase (DUF899 family)